MRGRCDKDAPEVLRQKGSGNHFRGPVQYLLTICVFCPVDLSLSLPPSVPPSLSLPLPLSPPPPPSCLPSLPGRDVHNSGLRGHRWCMATTSGGPRGPQASTGERGLVNGGGGTHFSEMQASGVTTISVTSGDQWFGRVFVHKLLYLGMVHLTLLGILHLAVLGLSTLLTLMATLLLRPRRIPFSNWTPF